MHTLEIAAEARGGLSESEVSVVRDNACQLKLSRCRCGQHYTKITHQLKSANIRIG